MKISRYISPQVYKSIFSGQKDVTIHTERKKLTIFFSDIQDFTATTERLQPEQITQLLNEYFTEMSAIALQHGGTIDKFVGDAMLIFFGDPETKGEAEDAQACLRMASRCSAGSSSSTPNGAMPESSIRSASAWASIPAIAMSAISAAPTEWTTRSSAPKPTWRRACNRSPSRAGIVISYETYALVRDIVVAQAPTADHHEGHQPRGRALRGEGHSWRRRRDHPRFQRAHYRARFLPQCQHDRCDQAGHVRKVLQDALDALDENVPAKPTITPAGATAPAGS